MQTRTMCVELSLPAKCDSLVELIFVAMFQEVRPATYLSSGDYGTLPQFVAAHDVVKQRVTTLADVHIPEKSLAALMDVYQEMLAGYRGVQHEPKALTKNLAQRAKSWRVITGVPDTVYVLACLGHAYEHNANEMLEGPDAGRYARLISERQHIAAYFYSLVECYILECQTDPNQSDLAHLVQHYCKGEDDALRLYYVSDVRQVEKSVVGSTMLN